MHVDAQRQCQEKQLRSWVCSRLCCNYTLCPRRTGRVLQRCTLAGCAVAWQTATPVPHFLSAQVWQPHHPRAGGEDCSAGGSGGLCGGYGRPRGRCCAVAMLHEERTQLAETDGRMCGWSSKGLWCLELTATCLPYPTCLRAAGERVRHGERDNDAAGPGAGGRAHCDDHRLLPPHTPGGGSTGWADAELQPCASGPFAR